MNVRTSVLACLAAWLVLTTVSATDEGIRTKVMDNVGDDNEAAELASLQRLRADLIEDRAQRKAYESAVSEDPSDATVSAIDRAQFDAALGTLSRKEAPKGGVDEEGNIDVDTKLPLQGKQKMEIEAEKVKVSSEEKKTEDVATEEAIVRIVEAVQEKAEESCHCGCPCHCCSHPQKSCAGYTCVKKGWRPVPNQLAILIPEGKEADDETCCEEIPKTCASVDFVCPNKRKRYDDVALNGRPPSASLCCEPRNDIVTDKTCADYMCPETHERVPNADKVKVKVPNQQDCCVAKLTCKTSNYKCKGKNMIPRGDFATRYLNSDQAASDELCCEKEELEYTCASVDCGEDWEPKSEDEAGGPFKEPPTRDQCCKAIPFTCEDVKCPTTHKVNPQAAGKEFPKQPQVADCCLKKQTCLGYKCKGADMELKTDLGKIYVLDQPSDADCCVKKEVVYTCATVKCEPDMIPKETDVTSKNPLTKDDCCEKRKFTCKTVRCPRDMKEIESKKEEEFDEEPEVQDCCEKKPTCALPLYECQKTNWVLKGDASNIFLDKPADDDTCCEEKEKEYTCEDVTCGADWNPRPEAKGKKFKESPSRTDCCIEKEYTCADDFGECPANWKPKTGGKTASKFKRKPTQADCCEEKKNCGKYKCQGKNMELRSTPETIFVDGEPSDDDCCVEKKPTYTCKDFDCGDDYEKRDTVSDTKPLFMDPPSKADCCTRKTYTCDNYKCEDNQKPKKTSKVFFSPPKTYDCCDDLPNCAEWNCVDPGKMLKPNADLIHPEKLSDDACCKDKPSYTCEGFVCMPQMADRKDAPTKLDAPPTKQDCCVPHTCEDYKCKRSNWVIVEKPGAVDLQSPPNDDKCCRQTYTCQDIDCPPDKRPKPLGMVKGDIAVYFTRPSADDCCEDRPTCLEYKCQSEDMMLKDQPELIYTDRPTDAKCCKPKPTFTCEGYNCPGPMFARDPAPKGLKNKPDDDACCLPYTCDGYVCKDDKYKRKEEESTQQAVQQEVQPSVQSQQVRVNSLDVLLAATAGQALTGPPDDEQCCELKQTCADYDCPADKVIIDNASTKYLPGAPSESQCCKKVEPLKMDVVIAMDFSYSAWKNPKDLALEIEYMEEVVDKLLDPDDVKHDNRVGVLAFSGKVTWLSKLTKDRSKLRGPGGRDSRTSLVDFRKAAFVTFTGRSVWPTFTELAIEAAQNELQSKGRADAAKMLFLMTDGSPWPQINYRGGAYRNEGGRHVSKTIQAAYNFKAAGLDIIYMSLHGSDTDMYRYLSQPEKIGSKETSVNMFSWVDPGDSNTLLSMCVYSAKYCDVCLSEYGCQAAFENDNTLNTRTIHKWTKDPSTKPWPSDPNDALIKKRWRTAAKKDVFKINYVYATPAQGMTRLQYTDLCWHRMADKYAQLKNGPDYADYQLHHVHIKEGWAGLEKRLAHYTAEALSDIDSVGQEALQESQHNDSD
eukprot:TRINITY_DN3325_c0_g1_i1.p1 TRINITY_DN3325_c0_g1~~TRINITY_DN3325_c0_g1_i1.p1  ORF type:complete len:1450 (-),score=476.50 TRINITY_DN3325_c0_g1_i1:614-4963(-)